MDENLQRALNEQLKSATPIAVDGEFGPQTEAAVKVWQKSQKLPETGEVNEAAVKRLGINASDAK